MKQPSALVNKRTLVKKWASGGSFIDIGGLWGLHGEMVTVAAEGGAHELTMADIQPADSKLWKAFEDHCASKHIDGVKKLVADVCAPDAPQKFGRYDFVHCSGLMYHVPDITAFIQNLLAISNEYLLVASVVLPDVIENEAGRIELGCDTSLLVPCLSDTNLAVLRTHFESTGVKAAGVNVKESFFTRDGTPRYGPWWWLFTGAFMSRFMAAFPVEIVADGFTHKDSVYAVLCRKTSA